MPHYVYILCSRPGGALYLGMTNDLRRRVDRIEQRLGRIETRLEWVEG